MRRRKVLCGNCNEMCAGEEECNCPCHWPDPDHEESESIEQPPFSSKIEDDVE